MNSSTTYPKIVKHAWFAMAVLLLVFCGPVKRLIEYKMSNESPTAFLQNVEKQLRTGVRERKDITPLVTTPTQQSPDSGLDFFIAASCVLILLYSRTAFLSRPTYGIAAVTGNFPRYLLLQQLRV